MSKINFISTNVKTITSSEIRQHNASVRTKIKYDPKENPKNLEKYNKEWSEGHWLYKYTRAPTNWLRIPYNMRIYDTSKDTETGNFLWNSNGAFPNR